jgi:hypothetical protein
MRSFVLFTLLAFCVATTSIGAFMLDARAPMLSKTALCKSRMRKLLLTPKKINLADLINAVARENLPNYCVEAFIKNNWINRKLYLSHFKFE